MAQIITGPKKMVVYHSGEPELSMAFPALNVPSLAFVRSGGAPANANHPPQTISLQQHRRRSAAVAQFGWPEPRSS